MHLSRCCEKPEVSQEANADLACRNDDHKQIFNDPLPVEGTVPDVNESLGDPSNIIKLTPALEIKANTKDTDNDSKNNTSGLMDGSVTGKAVNVESVQVEEAPDRQDTPAAAKHSSFISAGDAMRVMVSAVNSCNPREAVSQQCMPGPWETPIMDDGVSAFVVQSRRRLSLKRQLPRVVLSLWYNICIVLITAGLFLQCMYDVQRTYGGSVKKHFDCGQPFSRGRYWAMLGLHVILVSDYLIACIAFFTVNIVYLLSLAGALAYVIVGLYNDKWPCGRGWDMSGYVAFFSLMSYWVPRFWMTSPRVAKLCNVLFDITTFELQAFITVFKQTRIVAAMMAKRIKRDFTDDHEIVSKLHAQAEEALRSGSLKLLSGKKLLRMYLWSEKIIRCRQELEKEEPDIFVSPEEAVKAFSWHLRIVAISYPWISSAHPDPERFHMRSILKILPYYLYYNFVFGCFSADVAVFWDYACLPQGSKRTEEEQRQFDQGLAAINVLYGSPHSLVIQLKDMPTDDLKGRYESSGWCTFEAEVARMIKAPEQVIDEVQTRSARKHTCRGFMAKSVIRCVWIEILMVGISLVVVLWDRVGDSWATIMRLLFYIYLIEMLVKAITLALDCMRATSSFFFQVMILTLIIFFFHTQFQDDLFASNVDDVRSFSVYFFIIFRYYSFFDSLFASCRTFYELQMANEKSYKPPLPPEDMRELLQTKHFTNGSDYEFVCKKYERFFLEMADATTRLDFGRVRHAPGQTLLYNWVTDDMLRLARVLPSYHSRHDQEESASLGQKESASLNIRPLKSLNLEGRFLGDQEMVAIVRSLPASLESLYLHNCLFSEAGLVELASALSRLPKLTHLTLPSHLVTSPAGAKIEELRGSLWNMYGTQFWGYQDHFGSLLLNPLYIKVGPLKVAA